MLSKHLDRKTYSERWVVDDDDLKGLFKVLAKAAELNPAYRDFYDIALLTVSILFQDKSIDKWTNFMLEFDQAIGAV